MDNVIRISRDIKDLTGQGVEYLVDAENNIRAKFIDGQMPSDAPKGNTEPTAAGQVS